jgi:large subunit ribosomal protein L6
MSRIGKKVIEIPAGVTVDFTNGIVTVKGQKGTLTQEIKSPINVVIEAGSIYVGRSAENAQARSLHGLYNRLIANMVTGVSAGFTRTLILNGVGYKAAMKGQGMTLNLGYSHPSEVEAVEGITFKICTPQEIAALNLGKDGIGQVVQVMGISKEKVGAVASKIRITRRRTIPPIRYTLQRRTSHPQGI